ncbi:NAD(P)-dependent dehydrogenase (short-subunit alcohol dehydrogenase family) [Streptacidiphilus sp. MAP12-33]|uniref:SDR family NAD(P)-dependent oxidoreductase n=1 Tax=Streptacidiphilus sp. MAP12-33 TaxID=3156266 RepID=UPI003512BD9E
MSTGNAPDIRAGNQLEGKVALITGASSGIGAAAARLFAAEGAAVVLTARRKDRLDEVVLGIEAAGGLAVAVAGDVTSAEDCERAVAVAVDTYGRLDAAFNNAGWATAGQVLHEMTEGDYRRTLEVNVTGVWNCLRAQLPAMLESGGGSVVNTSSVAGTRATGASAAYVAAKHAVIGLTRAAAAEYGTQGVRVNALVVGSTRTEMMDQVLAGTPALEEAFLNESVQRRMAEPSEVARVAAWLCSDLSSFVTGAAVAVDGGTTAI